MPMHDWTRGAAGIFHTFHHDWITEIGRALNRGLLPADYYALPEQQAAEIRAEVLALPTRYAVVVRHVNGDRIVALFESGRRSLRCNAVGGDLSNRLRGHAAAVAESAGNGGVTRNYRRQIAESMRRSDTKRGYLSCRFTIGRASLRGLGTLFI
jgi:hypothetical protein